MRGSLTNEDRERQSAWRKRAWNKQAPRYERMMGWFERHVLGQDNRTWACSRANGNVLEVAVGTGLNLSGYAPDVRLTAIDLSPAMLEIAAERAKELGREIDLREGDAHDLPFGDASFDSVVCTFSLCNIPDVDRAISEMKRVLPPGGSLILVDHIRSESKVVLWAQKLLELITLRIEGDYMTRRPLEQVRAAGFDVVETERFNWGGIVERVLANKP